MKLNIGQDIFLRCIRTTSIKTPSTIAIGLDDFAFRERHRYGTLICDLIYHRPSAILAETTGEVVETTFSN